MSLVRRVPMRSLIPALGITLVLGLAFVLPPSSSFGREVAAGYGYLGNNCGVKGSGTHDDGKACPNRPFPGQGIGLAKAANSGEPVEQTSGESTPTNLTSSTDTTSDGGSNGVGHGRVKNHGRGHGHGSDD